MLFFNIEPFDYETQKDGKIKEQNIKTTSDLSRIVTLDAVIKIDDADYDKNYLEVEGFKVEKSGKKIYVCPICGYEEESETKPEKCIICGAEMIEKK